LFAGDSFDEELNPVVPCEAKGRVDGDMVIFFGDSTGLGDLDPADFERAATREFRNKPF
jgi:hypothetical protein